MSPNIDAHYSPSWVAQALVDLVPHSIDPLVVFDPAAGEGALLEAFVATMPDAVVIAADLNQATVRTLRTAHPTWELGCADAVNERSRAASVPWKAARSRGVDVVLMNPPFSFRGHGGDVVMFAGNRYRATPAVAFVATALEQLRPRVGLYAVLPRGAIEGERDRSLWSSIAGSYDVEVHAELPRGSFPSATATTVVVSISPAVAGPRLVVSSKPARALHPDCVCVEIIRGRLPVAMASSVGAGLTPWLHTRDVRESQAIVRWVDLPRSSASPGPMLVLPRVGKFDARKLAISTRSRIALSDCLYGLRVPTGRLDDLLLRLLDSSDALSARYFGTGAPHLTIRRLMDHLQSLGLAPRHVSASSEAGACRCRSDASSGPLNSIPEDLVTLNASAQTGVS